MRYIVKLNWEWIVWNDGRKFNNQTQGNWSNYRSYVWFVTTEKEFTFLNGIRWVENQLGDFNITSRTHSDLDVCLYLTFFSKSGSISSEKAKCISVSAGSIRMNRCCGHKNCHADKSWYIFRMNWILLAATTWVIFLLW